MNKKRFSHSTTPAVKQHHNSFLFLSHWRIAILTTLLFSLSLCLNYLHANSYPFYYPEALAFIGIFTGCFLLLFVVFHFLKCEWIYYALLLITMLDFTAGGASLIHPVIKKIISSRSLSISYLVMCVPVFIISYLLRKNIKVICLTMFLTIFITLVPVLPFRDNILYRIKEAPPQSSGAIDKPNIFFLILDEHIGIDGIPKSIQGGSDLGRNLAQHYTEQGFLVFRKAFSNYSWTTASLSSIFNQEIHLQRKEVQGIRRNRILQKLQKDGYRINTYQSDYLSFCDDDSAKCQKSFTYMQNSVGYLLEVNSPAVARLKSLFDGMIVSYKSVGLKAARKRLMEDPSYSGGIATDRVLDEMLKDLKRWPQGNVFLAHLLLPHYPHIFDSECNFRPEENIRNKTLPEQKYPRYFQQVNCVHRKLEGLFRELRRLNQYSGSTIFVMGDHGSRLRKQNVAPENAIPEDYLDQFSTFLAIKPGQYHPDFAEMAPNAGAKIPLAKVLWAYFSEPVPAQDEAFDRVYFRVVERFVPGVMIDFPSD